MFPNKKLSVITLTYNHQDFIIKTLKGIFYAESQFPH